MVDCLLPCGTVAHRPLCLWDFQAKDTDWLPVLPPGIFWARVNSCLLQPSALRADLLLHIIALWDHCLLSSPVMSNSCDLVDCRLLQAPVHGISSKNISEPSLLQGIFPSQGWNSEFLHWRADLYSLSCTEDYYMTLYISLCTLLLCKNNC